MSNIWREAVIAPSGLERKYATAIGNGGVLLSVIGALYFLYTLVRTFFKF